MRVITGSKLAWPSSRPAFIIATAWLPAPTPMIETCVVLRPTFDNSRLSASALDEPGAVTPIFSPTRSFGDLYFAASSLVSAITTPKELFCKTTDVMVSPCACR